MLSFFPFFFFLDRGFLSFSLMSSCFSLLNPHFSFEISSSFSVIPTAARKFHSIIYIFQGLVNLPFSSSTKSLFHELKSQAVEILTKFKQYSLILDSLSFDTPMNGSFRFYRLKEEDVEEFFAKGEKSGVESPEEENNNRNILIQVCCEPERFVDQLSRKQKKALVKLCDSHREYFDGYIVSIFWLLCARIQIRIFDQFPTDRSYFSSVSIEDCITKSIDCYPNFSNVYLRAYYCFRSQNNSLYTSDECNYSISCSVTNILRSFHLFSSFIRSFDPDFATLSFNYEPLIPEDLRGEKREKHESRLYEILKEEFSKILCLMRAINRFVNKEKEKKNYDIIRESVAKMQDTVDKFSRFEIE